MNILTFFLALTKSAAIIEIILLLLGAVTIGYVTAWLYYKSIYSKKIEIIENSSVVSFTRKDLVDIIEPRVSEILDLILKDISGKSIIVLETTAGQGTNVGYKFEQLKEIFKLIFINLFS